MAAEDTIPNWYQPTFTQNVQLLPQYKGVLLPFMDGDSYTGVQAEVVKQISAVVPVEDNERFGDTPNFATPRTGRWVSPRKWHWGTMFDEKDELKMLVDPSSKIVMNAAIGMGAFMDTNIINTAFFGPALTGKYEAQVSTPFPADGSQTIADTVGSADGVTSTGMNVAKLVALTGLARKNNIDLSIEKLNIALDWIQITDLFNDIKYIDRDYRGGTVLDSGTVTPYMGVNIIPMNGAGYYAGGIRHNPAWTTYGMHVGRWNDLKTELNTRPDKQNKPQAYMWQMAGATRTDEKRVFDVKNKAAA